MPRPGRADGRRAPRLAVGTTVRVATCAVVLAGAFTAVAAPDADRTPGRSAPAAAPAASAAPGTALRLSADGTEVIDPATGLAWSRCVEGMRWSGRRCTGEALMLSLPQARRTAAARAAAEGLAWRLPRVPELRRLRDHASHAGRGLPAWFPDAPEEALWTATVNAAPGRTLNPYNYGNVMQGRTGGGAADDAFMQGWAMDLPTGATKGDVSTSRRLALRLVRALAPVGAAPASAGR